MPRSIRPKHATLLTPEHVLSLGLRASDSECGQEEGRGCRRTGPPASAGQRPARRASPSGSTRSLSLPFREPERCPPYQRNVPFGTERTGVTFKKGPTWDSWGVKWKRDSPANRRPDRGPAFAARTPASSESWWHWGRPDMSLNDTAPLLRGGNCVVAGRATV